MSASPRYRTRRHCKGQLRGNSLLLALSYAQVMQALMLQGFRILETMSDQQFNQMMEVLRDIKDEA